MKIIPLPFETRGRRVKAIITYADFTAAAVTQTFSIFPDPAGQASTTKMPAGMQVSGVTMRLITPFTGGAVSAMVLDVGDGGSVGRHIANANTDLFTAAATNTKDQVSGGAAYTYSGKNFADGNTVLQAKFTSTGANVTACTAGRVEITFDLLELPRLDDPIEPGIVG